MSSKQLLRLALVLAAVLLLWGAVALGSRRGGGRSDASIVPRIDSAVVDSVIIQGPRDTTFLVRSRPGRWMANGHAADPQAVSELMKALAVSENEAELVAENPSSHARLKVSEDSGRRVRIVSKRGTPVQLITGKQTVEGGGLYLRRAGEPQVYVIRGSLASALGRAADEWRDRTIAAVVPDSVARLEVRRGSKAYSLRKTKNGWVFASGAPADSARVAGLLATYRSVKASGFGTTAEQDSLGFNRPRRSARLSNAAGRALLSLTFDSLASGLWVRVDSGGTEPSKEVYRMDFWGADQLTPADSTLRKK